MRPFLTTLLLVPVLCSAQEVGLSARANADHVRIGEWVEVQVNGHVSASVDTVAPATRDSLGSFEILSTSRDPKELIWRFRLTTMDSGTVFLPPIPFSYRRHGDTTIQRAYANSLAFQVSGMSIDPKGEIRDIKGPMNGPWKFEDIWPYLLGVVVLIGLGVGGVSYYRYWKRRRVRSVVSDIPAIPPHKEALSALRALEEQKLWQAGKIKPYYSEVTEIIRLFFEKRWHVIALELTTEEILGQLRRFPEAEAVWTEMGIFFRTADLVKFAKHIPSPEECTNEMRLAYDIVRAMIPHETPETVPMKEETADVR